jgi:hypothetical protein
LTATAHLIHRNLQNKTPNPCPKPEKLKAEEG